MVPREYIPAVEKGVDETLTHGVLAGYPVVDVKVTLTSVRTTTWTRTKTRSGWPRLWLQGRLPQGQPGHPRADDGRGSRNAGRLRRQRDGRPVVPSRHGAGHGRHAVGGGKIIKAEVPLSEMFGYSTTLRSMSQGRATYTMEFKHYSEAPKNVADAIITARGKVSRCKHRSAIRAPPVARGEGTASVQTLNRSRALLFEGRLKWQKVNSSGPSRT